MKGHGTVVGLTVWVLASGEGWLQSRGVGVGEGDVRLSRLWHGEEEMASGHVEKGHGVRVGYSMQVGLGSGF